MHALRVGEVKIQREIADDFLLELRVQCVDARVRIILVEDAHRSAEGNSPGWWHGLYTRPGGRPGGRAKAGKSKGRVAEDSELLHAVVGDRANLRQHVLAAIENAIAGAQHRLAVARYVPRKTNARLELFLRAVQRAVRWKPWITQQRSVGCLSRRDDRLGKDLGFPAQPIIQSEIGPQVPTVLSKQGQVFILNGGLAPRAAAFSVLRIADLAGLCCCSCRTEFRPGSQACRRRASPPSPLYAGPKMLLP